MALLSGIGGGHFACSISLLSTFFPKSQQGYGLGMNAGLGNFGVTTMQILIPLVMTVGLFGPLAGDPMILQSASGTLVGRIEAGSETWIQNAGFVWVPFLIIATIASWFGMNDIASAKASFSEQSVIFSRKHNWIMCVLYTGTFGSFIGYSAGFPLLTKLQFPEVNALQFVFLGPLVGALSRAATGWISDKFGGGRVTFWTFLGMIAAVFGVIWVPSPSTEGFKN